MGFGNPYKDPWNPQIVMEWTERMASMGITIISLADTIGVAQPETISLLFRNLVPAFPNVEFGAHFHTTPSAWREKIDAAYENGCRRFDGAIKGYGGCPMAMDELTGNMPTENLIGYFQEKKIDLKLDDDRLYHALKLADEVFQPAGVV